MRRTAAGASSRRQLLVGIASEPVTSYGRSILWGVITYANLQRNWVLHKDMWGVTDVAWPECDGTIVGGVQAHVFPNVRAHSRHLVTCSGSYDPDEIPVVALDDDATGAMAAEHLAGLGLKNFAFYPPEWARDYPPAERPQHTFARRARGFQAALRARGFACIRSDAESPRYRDLLTHSHHPQLVAWLRSLPTPIGIMAVDDTHAHDLAEACREAGISVPERVAIIGVNNDELLCEGAWPPLTSVECNFTRMGYQAAKTLDRLMAGERLARGGRLVELPPVRVHQRMSTNVLAVGEPDVAEAVRHIREHACDPCSVSDLMRAMPVSRRTLERRFAEVMGRTLHDEIARVRLETARRLLVQADLSIDEIGHRCGFSALQSFNRFFRQSLGVTPAAFRRRSGSDAKPKPSGSTHA